MNSQWAAQATGANKDFANSFFFAFIIFLFYMTMLFQLGIYLISISHLIVSMICSKQLHV